MENPGARPVSGDQASEIVAYHIPQLKYLAVLTHHFRDCVKGIEKSLSATDPHSFSGLRYGPHPHLDHPPTLSSAYPAMIVPSIPNKYAWWCLTGAPPGTVRLVLLLPLFWEAPYPNGSLDLLYSFDHYPSM